MPRTGDEKIALMHRRYGVLSGAKCKDCPHLDVYSNYDETRFWYKCYIFGVTSGPGTDWRCGNEACGAIRIDHEDARKQGLYGEVYRLVRGDRPKYREPELEGQLAMDI